MLVGPLTIYLFVFSFIASVRKIDLWAYWAGVGAALAPWIAVILISGFAVERLPKNLQQAAGMTIMFPALAGITVAVVSPIVALFVEKEMSLPARAKWFALISGVPAVLMLAFILWIFIKDSQSAGGAG
jgi:hypothetical protein